MKNNRGNNLLIVLGIVSVIMIISIAIIYISVTTTRITTNNYNRVQSYYTSETGIERAQNYINGYLSLSNPVGYSIEINQAEGPVTSNSAVKYVVLKYTSKGSNYITFVLTSTGVTNNESYTSSFLYNAFFDNNGNLTSVTRMSEIQ